MSGNVLVLTEEQAKIVLSLMRRVEDGLGIGDLREDDWVLFDAIEAAFPGCAASYKVKEEASCAKGS